MNGARRTTRRAPPDLAAHQPREANRSASRPVASSSSFSFFTRVALGDFATTNTTPAGASRVSLCTVPRGTSPPARRRAPRAHRDAGSLSAAASSNTSSFAAFGGGVVPAPPFPSPARFPASAPARRRPPRATSPSRATPSVHARREPNDARPETAPCVVETKTPQCGGHRTLPLSPSRARRPRPSARPRPRPPSRWTSPRVAPRRDRVRGVP